MTEKKQLIVVRDGKRQELTDAERFAAAKEAADAERKRIFEEGKLAGRHEAHHARKYVAIGLVLFGAALGAFGGTLLTAHMYERSMSRGVVIGGAIAQSQDDHPRLTIDGEITRDEDAGWVRGRGGWSQPDGERQ